MTTVLTVQGDTLDDLIAQHYGADAVSAALGAVLAANVGLAELSNVLPAGVRIVLPAPTIITRQWPALW